MHSNESFEQGAYDNLPVELSLIHTYPPIGGQRLSEREHYLRTMICAIESIRSGVTTVQDDLLVVGTEPEALDGAAKAYRDAGLRAVITVAMWDRPFLDCMPFLRELVPAALAAELDRTPPPPAPEQVALFGQHYRTWHGTAGSGSSRRPRGRSAARTTSCAARPSFRRAMSCRCTPTSSRPRPRR